VARLLQGVSSAIVWTVGIAVLADTMPTEQLGVAMGTVGSVISLAMVSAPILGGAIFHNFGFEAVFWVLGAMLLVDVILRLMMIERKDADKWGVNNVESTTSPEADESTQLLDDSPVEVKSEKLITLLLVLMCMDIY
jgi:MFS family permease